MVRRQKATTQRSLAFEKHGTRTLKHMGESNTTFCSSIRVKILARYNKIQKIQMVDLQDFETMGICLKKSELGPKRTRGPDWVG